LEVQFREKLMHSLLIQNRSLAMHVFLRVPYSHCGTWWRLGWDNDFQRVGREFESRSSRHVWTLGKSFACSCLCASAWNSDTVFVL